MKEQGGCRRGSSCVMPVGGHMTQSGDEAEGRLGTHEQVLQTVCVMWWGGQGAHIECRCAVRD